MKKIITGILIAATLSGCMGRNALSRRVTKFNLTAAESRWGREGLFVGMWVTLIYPVCGLLDLLIFNSMEFWQGENPLNGESPLLELPMDQVRKLGFNEIESAQVERLTTDKAKLYLDFKNGDRVSFDVVRDRDAYTVSYRGVEFYTGQVF